MYTQRFHGDAWKSGSNFSFILGGANPAPEPADSASYRERSRFIRTFIQTPGRVNPGQPPR